jgi:hypothetical protein
MITSDTQQIEQLIQELREPWAHAGTPDERLDQLRQMVLRLANDRADARELSDDRLMLCTKLLKEKVHYFDIAKEQGQVIASQIEHQAKQDRRLKTIELTVNSIDAPAWNKLQAIQEIFKTEL